MNRYHLTKEKLEKYDQVHLLSFYEELDEKEQVSLLDQIDTIDFEEIQHAYQELLISPPNKDRDISSIDYEAVADLPVSSKDQYIERGLDLIKNHKVAVVLLAGGQGSRLGHEGPKGTVSLNDSPENSLFSLQAKQLKKLESETGTKIRWYIMTSPINDEETKDFFKTNHYFNLDQDQITFFQQDFIPTMTPEGKIILESKSKISMAPNGNGGVFASMKANGVLKDLNDRGVEWVFFNNIDNALVQVADPLFIGFADEKGAEISSKSVKKRDPNEKAGVLCLSDGKPVVIEYSELKENEREDEHLINANIGIHLFKLDFLENTKDKILPYHLAYKAIPTIDEQGKTFKPESPNGYKLEKFYFDLFPYAEKMSVLQVQREKEFAPIKNRTGEDSLESARKIFGFE